MLTAMEKCGSTERGIDRKADTPMTMVRRKATSVICQR